VISHNDQLSALFAQASSGAALLETDTSDDSLGASDVDVLSDVLRVVRLNGAVFFLTDATSPWSVQVPNGKVLAPIVQPTAQNVISFHMVTSGSCWCDGPHTNGIWLETGDIVVISGGDWYRLCYPERITSEWTPEQIRTFFRLMAAGELPFVVHEGGGGPERLQVLCGFLGCDMLPFNPILTTLPPILHVPRAQNGQGERLSHLIHFAMEESRERRAGSHSVLLRIAELTFVEVLRQHLATLEPGQTGWLAGLRDPVVGRALALMHRNIDHPWTLQTLAREAGLSRSALAERFTHYVGTPPMHYLTQWRMQAAAQLLANSTAKVAAIAAEVGYESEAAFCRAFTRSVGVPPATWRKQRVAAGARTEKT
jgi:AraC-like DNA-binding protein